MKNSPHIFIHRWGGMIWSPRQVAGSISPYSRIWDGWLLFITYVGGAKLWEASKIILEATAFSGLNALQQVLSSIFVIAPWILTSLLIDIIIPNARRDIRRLCLVPLVMAAIIAHLLSLTSLTLPGPRYGLEIVGATWSIALALRIRPLFTQEDKSSRSQNQVFPWHWLLTGCLLLALSMVGLGIDLRQIYLHGASIRPLAKGEIVPTFQVSMLEGPPLRNQDLENRISLFVFWTSWCQVCDAEMPMLAELHRQFTEQGFQVIAINNDQPSFQRSIAERYRRERKLPFPIALDPGALAHAFRVSAYPHMVLVDQRQQIRFVHKGKVQRQTLEQEIHKLF